jgi:hypothetical protein
VRRHWHDHRRFDKLPAETPDDLRRKVVQYETGLEVPPGTYHVKVVVRENANGAMGSFETDMTVPDVAEQPAAAGNGADRSGAIRLLISIAFFRGGIRVFETPVLTTTDPTDRARQTAAFRFDVPAVSLPPGLYTCQVNVIDDVAGTFAFPRIQIAVRRQGPSPGGRRGSPNRSPDIARQH